METAQKMQTVVETLRELDNEAALLDPSVSPGVAAAQLLDRCYITGAALDALLRHALKLRVIEGRGVTAEKLVDSALVALRYETHTTSDVVDRLEVESLKQAELVKLAYTGLKVTTAQRKDYYGEAAGTRPTAELKEKKRAEKAANRSRILEERTATVDQMADAVRAQIVREYLGKLEQGADGIQRALLNFTDADWAAKQADAWVRRDNGIAMGDAITLIRATLKTKKSTLADLAPRAQAKIMDAVATAAT